MSELLAAINGFAFGALAVATLLVRYMPPREVVLHVFEREPEVVFVPVCVAPDEFVLQGEEGEIYSEPKETKEDEEEDEDGAILNQCCSTGVCSSCSHSSLSGLSPVSDEADGQ